MNMKSEITPFCYGEDLVRVVNGEDGEPWFVAKDVCKILSLQNVSDAVKNLDDDEKGVGKIYPPERPDGVNVNTLSESGLYTLIIRSNKPDAKPFRRWITHEVLPTIRKTGAYTMPGADPGGMMSDDGVKKSGNMYFPMAKLVESADKYLGGEAALRALNYFTGMPVDDLIDKLEEKKHAAKISSLEWGKSAVDDFLVDACEFGDMFSEQASVLYKAFCTWCRNNGIAKPITQKRFGALMTAAFDKEKSGVFRYVGLRLKEDAEHEVVE